MYLAASENESNWLSFSRRVWRWPDGDAAPDVVIGSSPHLFAALAAERLAARWGVPFVFEVRDLWPESLLAAGGRRSRTDHQRRELLPRRTACGARPQRALHRR